MAANRPRHATTAEAIGRRIVSGSIKPGTVLPNAERLALEYRVSRPALREAIKLLAGKGLLETAPRRGTVVRPKAAWNRLDVEVIGWEAGETQGVNFVRDLFELRRMIEPEAAALAAERASPEGIVAIGMALEAMGELDYGSQHSVLADLAFHRAILIHSCNEFLSTFAAAIEAYLKATFEAHRSGGGQLARAMFRDHEALYIAIRDRKPDEARAAAFALLQAADDRTMPPAGRSRPTLALDAGALSNA